MINGRTNKINAKVEKDTSDNNINIFTQSGKKYTHLPCELNVPSDINYSLLHIFLCLQ